MTETSQVSGQRLRATTFSRVFLERSRCWLRDPEIRGLVMAPEFTDKEQEDFFRGLSGRADYMIWGIMIDGDNPIGAFGLKEITSTDAHYWGYIGQKEWWGRGIGLWMICTAETRSRELGLESLWLKVAPDNRRAVGLYEKAGYDIVKDDASVVIYRKRLRRSKK